MNRQARAKQWVSAVAAGLVLAGAALPTVIAFSQCRMSGTRVAMPCCDRPLRAQGEDRASLRAAPCCEQVSLRAERIPPAATAEERAFVPVAGPVIALLDGGASPRSERAWRWRQQPVSTAAGPPIYLETCSLLI